MLRATLNVNKKIEIKNYPSLIAFINRRKSVGHNITCDANRLRSLIQVVLSQLRHVVHRYVFCFVYSDNERQSKWGKRAKLGGVANHVGETRNGEENRVHFGNRHSFATRKAVSTCLAVIMLSTRG
jgi:hypothetical protein